MKRRTTPKANVVSPKAIASALHNTTIKIPGTGCTIFEVGFNITITIQPGVGGGNVIVQITPSSKTNLPAHIGRLKLTKGNHSVEKSFGSTGKATFHGIVKGSYTLSLV